MKISCISWFWVNKIKRSKNEAVLLPATTKSFIWDNLNKVSIILLNTSLGWKQPMKFYKGKVVSYPPYLICSTDLLKFFCCSRFLVYIRMVLKERQKVIYQHHLVQCKGCNGSQLQSSKAQTKCQSKTNKET